LLLDSRGVCKPPVPLLGVPQDLLLLDEGGVEFEAAEVEVRVSGLSSAELLKILDIAVHLRKVFKVLLVGLINQVFLKLFEILLRNLEILQLLLHHELIVNLLPQNVNTCDVGHLRVWAEGGIEPQLVSELHH